MHMKHARVTAVPAIAFMSPPPNPDIYRFILLSAVAEMPHSVTIWVAAQAESSPQPTLRARRKPHKFDREVRRESWSIRFDRSGAGAPSGESSECSGERLSSRQAPQENYLSAKGAAVALGA